jgi:hypothetical protein
VALRGPCNEDAHYSHVSFSSEFPYSCVPQRVSFMSDFLLCLLNPCLSFCTWANAHEVFLERELFLSQEVASGGVIARVRRWSRG